MNFTHPAWLLLLPTLAFLAWQWPRGEWRRPLRAACLLALTLALADPHWQRLEPGVDLWVLVDRSSSAADLLGPRIPEWEGLLREGMSKNDRLRFVDFGEGAAVRAEEPGAVAEVRPDQTRITSAIRLAVLQHDPSRASRLLLLSDGYPTEPLTGTAGLLARAGIPMDVRLVSFGQGADFQVDSIQAPTRVPVGEPYVIDVRLHGEGNLTATVPYSVERDGTIVAQGRVELQNGLARIRLTDRLARAGAAHFVARLFPEADALPGNNQAETWIEATAGPRVLLITAYADDPVAAALRAQGVEVEVETEPGLLHTGRLSGARAVILDNVPANALPQTFMPALEFYVREQGGGLAMLGGKNSFGSGGYYKSRLDEILPVSLELRQEQRKLAVAMAIVLDRSGSMSMQVPTATGMKMKIELADAGAAAAIRLLGPQDAVAVLAVDAQAHPVVPLINVDPQRDDILARVMRISSMGGGIYVPTGLRAAWAELQKATAGQKHIILFADANDATQELAGYKEITEEIIAGGGSLSIIGMGTDHDSGATYLKDIADLAKGRLFFCADPNDLPAVFSQDAVAVARSTFVKDPAALQGLAAWRELAVSAQPLKWPEQVDGYNLCYLQPHAASAAVTTDENLAPLVAFWSRGAGRAGAVTFPLAGAYSDTVRAWPGYGDFVTTFTRWLIGQGTPPGVSVKAHLDGDQLVVDLFYESRLENELARSFPQAVFTQGGYEERQGLTWERLQPGHFQARARLIPGKPAIGAVQVGGRSLPFGPLAPGHDLEWHRDTAGPRALRALAAGSGGEELTQFSEAWRETGQQRDVSLRPWLILLLVLLVLVEAAATRLGVLTAWTRRKPLAASSSVP